MRKIESKHNKTIKWIIKLINDPKFRKETKYFCAEGKKVIESLLNSSTVINLVVSESYLFKNQKILSKFYDKLLVLPNEVFSQLSTLKTPEGIMGIFENKERKIIFDKEKNYLALVDIQNPNNLGAIIRSSLAFDIAGIFLINSHVDLYNQDVIRSSSGYVFEMPISYYNNFEYFLSDIKKNNLSLVATALTSKSIELNKYKKYKGNCFLIGNEGSGLNEALISKCEQTIKIVINEKVESLNVANAVSIIAYYLKSNENN